MISFMAVVSVITKVGTLATVTANTVGAAKKLWKTIWGRK